MSTDDVFDFFHGSFGNVLSRALVSRGMDVKRAMVVVYSNLVRDYHDAPSSWASPLLKSDPTQDILPFRHLSDIAQARYLLRGIRVLVSNTNTDKHKAAGIFGGQSNLASDAVPDIVLRVLPQVPQSVFGRPKQPGELVIQNPFDVGLLV